MPIVIEEMTEDEKEMLKKIEARSFEVLRERNEIFNEMWEYIKEQKKLKEYNKDQ